MQDIHAQRILILDFGSQYTQLIARRVREIGVYCEIRAFDMTAEEIREFAPKGIILSGGPESVTAAETPRAPEAVFEAGIPVLGICYGMQTMAEQLGGKVIAGEKHEFGYARVEKAEKNRLLDGIVDHEEQGKEYLDVWMSHGDRVGEMPAGFVTTATTGSCPIAGMANDEKRFYGIQFHPEVTHTLQGGRLLERFVRELCDCEALWTPSNIINDAIDTIREQVGTDEVILGLSGGVDSSVVAALLHKAIGDQLTCVFVDNGLLRHQEGDQVMAMFAENMGVKVIRSDAEDLFLGRLAGVSDPEEKRKVIGRTFIEVFDTEATKLKDVKFLAQGTIYPDVIESAGAKTGKAHVIKSHHNVGGLPEDMAFELVEPLRELFKDEVRALGRELGLPDSFIGRHPFPGPGLAIRCPGQITREKLEILRRADAVFIDQIRRHGLYDEIWQAFVAILPVRTVGVMGDGRTYDFACALRAVTSVDGMTADYYPFPHDFLGETATRIINEVKGINRVTYDITSKPPGTIEWE